MTRTAEAGVTLVEMLVVLALFGLLAGAVVLAFPSDRSATGPAARALTFKADLERAIDLALLRQTGFGIQRDDGALHFVEQQKDGTWGPHTEKTLDPVKLSGRTVRSSLETGAVFAVSPALVPGSSDPLRVTFGPAQVITFDGAGIREEEGSDGTFDRRWLQFD
jgi:general secretion pathway protein H